MKTNERLIVYVGLVLVGAMSLVALLDGLARPAVAGPLRQDAAMKAADAPALGPASSVRFVEDDDEPLVLRNRRGRPAWGDAGYHRAHSLAFVHIGPLMTELMTTEEFNEERDALVEELREVEEDYRERLNEIRGRVESLDPASPDAEEARALGQQLLQEAQQWGLEAQRRQGELQAEQMVQAYQELVDAVNVVAERLDIDVVLRYIPPEEPFDDATPDQALVSIRLRTALRCPEEIDITPEVAEELSLEIE